MNIILKEPGFNQNVIIKLFYSNLTRFPPNLINGAILFCFKVKAMDLWGNKYQAFGTSNSSFCVVSKCDIADKNYIKYRELVELLFSWSESSFIEPPPHQKPSTNSHIQPSEKIQASSSCSIHHHSQISKYIPNQRKAAFSSNLAQPLNKLNDGQKLHLNSQFQWQYQLQTQKQTQTETQLQINQMESIPESQLQSSLPTTNKFSNNENFERVSHYYNAIGFNDIVGVVLTFSHYKAKLNKSNLIIQLGDFYLVKYPEILTLSSSGRNVANFTTEILISRINRSVKLSSLVSAGKPLPRRSIYCSIDIFNSKEEDPTKNIKIGDVVFLRKAQFVLLRPLDNTPVVCCDYDNHSPSSNFKILSNSNLLSHIYEGPKLKTSLCLDDNILTHRLAQYYPKNKLSKVSEPDICSISDALRCLKPVQVFSVSASISGIYPTSYQQFLTKTCFHCGKRFSSDKVSCSDGHGDLNLVVSLVIQLSDSTNFISVQSRFDVPDEIFKTMYNNNALDFGKSFEVLMSKWTSSITEKALLAEDKNSIVYKPNYSKWTIVSVPIQSQNKYKRVFRLVDSETLFLSELRKLL